MVKLTQKGNELFKNSTKPSYMRVSRKESQSTEVEPLDQQHTLPPSDPINELGLALGAFLHAARNWIKRNFKQHVVATPIDPKTMSKHRRPHRATPSTITPQIEHGYIKGKCDVYDPQGKTHTYDSLIVSAPLDKIFDLFTEIISDLPDPVDVILEQTDQSPGNDNLPLRRNGIDVIALVSILENHRERLLHDDGLTISILSSTKHKEVRLNGNKSIVIYGGDMDSPEQLKTTEATIVAQGLSNIYSFQEKILSNKNPDIQSLSQDQHLDLLRDLTGELGIENQ